MSTPGQIIPGYPTTTADGLVLIFGGYTLTLTRYRPYPGRYPRVEPEYYTLRRSLEGNTTREGTLFRPPAVWTFEAILTLEQQATLQRMEAKYLATPGPWTLYDYTRPFADDGARKRGLAPNSVPDTTGGDALYYAAFNAEPTAAFEVVESNPREDVVSFQLTEGEPTSP